MRRRTSPLHQARGKVLRRWTSRLCRPPRTPHGLLLRRAMRVVLLEVARREVAHREGPKQVEPCSLSKTTAAPARARQTQDLLICALAPQLMLACGLALQTQCNLWADLARQIPISDLAPQIHKIHFFHKCGLALEIRRKDLALVTQALPIGVAPLLRSL